jgi:hypothetical protein
MDLSVSPEKVCEVLEDVRNLLRENILPRLEILEEQVRLLRKVTWPVCQKIKEKSQLSDMQSKKEFLSSLDPDEVLMLLKMKSSGFLAEECHALGLHKVNGYEKRHE